MDNVNTAARKDVPGVFELYKGEWWPATVLQVYEGDLPVLVEEVFNVLAPTVRGKIAHVDASLVLGVATRHVGQEADSIVETDRTTNVMEVEEEAAAGPSGVINVIN